MDAFDYAAPQDLQEALSLLTKANGNARPLAGGTDLIAQMKEKRRSPGLIINVKKIPELNVSKSARVGDFCPVGGVCKSE